MKIFFTNFKTLLFLVIAMVSATTASAWSVRLSDKYSVSGYTMKAFYNLSSNESGIMPTSGDLRYRDANNGLFNFGGGNRGADLNIPVSKDDIIVFDFNDTQSRSVTVNSVTNGTKVADLSGTYPTFSISADATTINVNIGRGGCIMSIVVMEKDQAAATADYTINYKMGETTVKTVNGNTTVGNTVKADASFVENGVKYIATSSTLSMDITSGTNVLNVDVREAATYNYTVVAKDGETTMATLANGSSLEGDNVTVGYPEYMLNDGTLFSAPKGGDWYRRTFTPNADKYEEKIAYTNAGITNVVFYTDAELLAGASAGTNTARASRGQMGYTANSETYINATTLAPGKYQIYARGVNGNSATRTANFKVNENVVWAFSIPNGTDTRGNSEEFTVYAETTLEFASDGSSASGCDWFYIVKTGEVTEVPVEISAAGWATFYAPCAVDFTDNAIKAYIVSNVNAETVTLEEVSKVAAGDVVIVNGKSGNVNVTEDFEPEYLNALSSFDEPLAYDCDPSTTFYVLAKQGDDVVFAPVTSGTIAAHKGFLAIPSVSADPLNARLNVVIGGTTTGISNVDAVKVNNNVVYNLNGQRVNANVKGIVIMNGKKVVK